jgi:hypothetical protein
MMSRPGKDRGEDMSENGRAIRLERMAVRVLRNPVLTALSYLHQAVLLRSVPLGPW